jgi:hypothetical protein
MFSVPDIICTVPPVIPSGLEVFGAASSVSAQKPLMNELHEKQFLSEPG